jgi:hypothetical protein
MYSNTKSVEMKCTPFTDTESDTVPAAFDAGDSHVAMTSDIYTAGTVTEVPSAETKRQAILVVFGMLDPDKVMIVPPPNGPNVGVIDRTEGDETYVRTTPAPVMSTPLIDISSVTLPAKCGGVKQTTDVAFTTIAFMTESAILHTTESVSLNDVP